MEGDGGEGGGTKVMLTFLYNCCKPRFKIIASAGLKPNCVGPFLLNSRGGPKDDVPIGSTNTRAVY